MTMQRSTSSSGVGTDYVETEWRFEAEDLGAIEGSIGALSESSGFSMAADEAREIQDTYLDTDDWRLYRAGYALRIRRTADGTEATMKSLPGTTDGVRRRVSSPMARRSSAPRTCAARRRQTRWHSRCCGGTSGSC